MRRVHNLLRAESKKRSRIALAAVLLFIDRECDWRSNYESVRREDRGRLRHRDGAFLSSDANAPFLGDAGRDPKSVKRNVQNPGAYHCESRTKQQRENKSFSQRGQINLRPNRNEPATDNSASQRVRGRNRKSGERCENDSQPGANSDSEQKGFRSGEVIRNDAFAAEFSEQCLREKDRHDRSGKRRDCCPEDCCAIAASSTAEERRDACDVIVRTIGVCQKRGSQH